MAQLFHLLNEVIRNTFMNRLDCRRDVLKVQLVEDTKQAYLEIAKLNVVGGNPLYSDPSSNPSSGKEGTKTP